MDTSAASAIRAYVDRVLRLKEDIKALNADVSDIYKEAAGNGFDKKALQATVNRAALPRDDLHEQDALVDLYWSAYTGTSVATRARAPEASATPHDSDGVVVEPAALYAITDTSAAIPGGAESRPSEPSSDAAPPADAVAYPANPSTLSPIPVQSHKLPPIEVAPLPDFLIRDKANRAPWMDREAAE